MEIAMTLSHGAHTQPKIELKYMKNILHVAHFHIDKVLLSRNVFKQAHVIKIRGALGTGFTYAPVSLFELYLAINNSSTSHDSPSEILLLYELRVTLEKEEYFRSTSHYSSSFTWR